MLISPTRESAQAVGYDVYSTDDYTLHPHLITKIPLDISIQPPPGTYIQIMSRSGLALRGITVLAGVIDPDYRGNITVLLHNNSSIPILIKYGDQVAQILFKNVSTPTLLTSTVLTESVRNTDGFGSTDRLKIAALEDLSQPLPPMPYNIYLSEDPFDDVIAIAIDDFGCHSTMGLVLQHCPYRNRPQLMDILPSQPASRIKRWRSTIKNSYVTQIDEHTIQTIDDIISAIKQCRFQKIQPITIEFSVEVKPSGIHPTEGIPMLFSDQLNVIAQYVNEIQDKHWMRPDPAPNYEEVDSPTLEPISHLAHTQTDEDVLYETLFCGQKPIVRQFFDPTFDPENDWVRPASTNPTPLDIPIPPRIESGQKYTPKQIRNSPDYAEWKASQFQQLDMFEEQDMFGPPEERQKWMNVWKLLWIFVQKPPPDNRKKARCVVNASKRGRQNAKVGHTFANSLSQDSERLFWALAAKLGLLVIGADISNAFAEASMPDSDVYIQPDEIFRDWWINHKQRPPIPPGWVLKVNYAFQGHPEAPRLWERHIDRILQNEITLRPTRHAPCLYSGTVSDTYVMLLRQVDDFAVAVTTENIGQAIIHDIDKHMRIPIKYQGILQMYNGLDIEQTRYYIKIHCGTYLRKALGNNSHLVTNSKLRYQPLPYPADHEYTMHLDTAVGPSTPYERDALTKTMNMNYRQVIGMWIWPMIKCRPEISFHITKLSQSMANPAQVHYEALKHVSQFLAQTIDDGLYFWRDEPKMGLPEGPFPVIQPDNYTFDMDPHNIIDRPLLQAYADSDWASCRKTHNAVTGGIIMVAGCAVGYKTKFQKAVALSSTEAEWAAACEIGKMILYFRSLLEDLGQPQHTATTLYEDNRGVLFMANQQQTSNRTRHIDIKQFALIDWVEQDLMVLAEIKSPENCSDALTKALARILFYRHNDTIMGRRIPAHLDKFVPKHIITRLKMLDMFLGLPRAPLLRTISTTFAPNTNFYPQKAVEKPLTHVRL